MFVDFRANARKSTKISEKKTVAGAHPDEGSGAAIDLYRFDFFIVEGAAGDCI